MVLLRLLPLLFLLLIPFASPALPTDDEPMEPVAAFGNLPETETAGTVLPVKTLPPEELTVSFDELYELTSATGEERVAKARALIAERWGSESILNAEVEAGNPSALLMVALIRDDSDDASRVLDKLDLAARNGHPYAQYIVGSRKIGSKQPAIRREGLELLDLAGAAGYDKPLYAACRARLYGDRDLRDPNRAIADLWRARELGSGAACRSLGYLFNTGLHVKKDVPRSVALYEEASNRGDVKGRQYFAACLRDGEGVAPQPERAFELFKLNDAAGHAEAGYSLFLWYSECV